MGCRLGMVAAVVVAGLMGPVVGLMATLRCSTRPTRPTCTTDAAAPPAPTMALRWATRIPRPCPPLGGVRVVVVVGRGRRRWQRCRGRRRRRAGSRRARRAITTCHSARRLSAGRRRHPAMERRRWRRRLAGMAALAVVVALEEVRLARRRPMGAVRRAAGRRRLTLTTRVQWLRIRRPACLPIPIKGRTRIPTRTRTPTLAIMATHMARRRPAVARRRLAPEAAPTGSLLLPTMRRR